MSTAALWLVCASLGAATWAETPTAPPAPDVEVLVREALERSPELAVLRARAEAAKQEVSPAGALPDPMFEVMLQDVNFPSYTVGDAEMSMFGVELRQGLPFPGKRGARREAMEAEAENRRREVEEVERRLTAEVRMLYARLYAQDRARQSLLVARELVDVLSATVASRYSSGEDALEAQLKTQVEKARVEERLEDLAAERAEASAELNRRLDRAGDSPFGEVRQLPEVMVPEPPWEGLALQRSPRVTTQSAELEAAERRLQVARRDQAPDLSAGVGYATRGDLDHVVTLRLGVELPIWSGKKQKPLVGAARSQVHASEHALREARAAARAEAARLRAAWQRSEAQVLRYRDAILPQTSTAFDAARGAYMAGRGDFSTVIEDFDLWLEARIDLAAREAERYATWAEVEALLAPGAVRGEDRR